MFKFSRGGRCACSWLAQDKGWHDEHFLYSEHALSVEVVLTVCAWILVDDLGWLTSLTVGGYLFLPQRDMKLLRGCISDGHFQHAQAELHRQDPKKTHAQHYQRRCHRIERPLSKNAPLKHFWKVTISSEYFRLSMLYHITVALLLLCIYIACTLFVLFFFCSLTNFVISASHGQ